MRLVQTADRYPGVCAATGASEGPFIATERFCHVNQGDEVFLSAQLIAEAAGLLGWMAPEAVRVAAERERVLHAQREELAALREQHTTLLDRVGYTLQHGAVVRGNKIKLRIPPWERGKRRGGRAAAS